MIRLSRMTQSEYDKWRERSIREYIEENVKSGRWSAKEAATLAEKEFQQILPDGRATRDHFFFTIQDEATKRQVGSIWFQANRDQPAHPFCYLWDLLVYEEYRRRGFASQAMHELEVEGRRMGLEKIRFNVFAHNLPAIGLYEKLGYKSTNMYMSKKLEDETNTSY